MKHFSVLLCRALLFICLGLVSLEQTACTSKRTTSETTVVDASGPRTVERTTTTETETDSDGCGGVLSCTIDAIGTVIALPFKAVGALIGAIF